MVPCPNQPVPVLLDNESDETNPSTAAVSCPVPIPGSAMTSTLLDGSNNNAVDVSVDDKSPEKPRRNLSKAFDALCVISPDDTIKEEKTDGGHSPTAVQDFACTSTSSAAAAASSTSSTASTPTLTLPATLQRDLSDQCVQRVAWYSIVHDINKETASLVATDPLESSCPLVRAGQCQPSSNPSVDPATVSDAMVDEEQWLLRTVHDCNDNTNTTTACPATFSQAMGEKDYDQTRTQLWKPSRSWWEAKSGKNPWIEPGSHNKRWRYLWPLIHYHKFLAKCIKKLKRNGVDVKLSVSPVSVFLRQEVCAISDHLRAVSLFASEAWMECLVDFEGWGLGAAARAYVATLPLRPLHEPKDVDSPVLRNQIDAAFLKAQSTVPRQIHGRPRYFRQQQHQQAQAAWYGYEKDQSSVQSELSANSYPQYYHPMYMPPPQPHGAPHAQPAVSPADHHSHSTGGGGYAYPEHYWMPAPMVYGAYYPPPPEVVSPATPYKYPLSPHMSSPYWTHLDQATAAMIATPTTPSPQPQRRTSTTQTTPLYASSFLSKRHSPSTVETASETVS